MKHYCHVRRCPNMCPQSHLMCGACWAMVPTDLQQEVYDTVDKRAKAVDRTWAPWWRAQARAIDAVLRQRPKAIMKAIDALLNRELEFAEYLEKNR